MSNTDLIIEERSRDIGDFLVGRLIPFRKKRMVGPFIFIDHMGPSEIGPGKYMDVDQHPHIGLSTLTYLLEGEIHHRDSIGTDQICSAGDVNWMTAGSYVTHTERTPNHLRKGQITNVHGYQIWVALPKELEDITPTFQHLDNEELPQWLDEGAKITLVAGKGFGRKSPLDVYSELFMVDIEAKDHYSLKVNGELKGEIGIVIVSGSIQACEHTLESGQMLVSKIDNQCDLQISAGSRVLLFGGIPFPEERHIFWNFVSTSKETIEKAKQIWKEWQFPSVPNDDTYVPMPEEHFKRK